DEVAATRLRPPRDALAAKLTLEHAIDRLELRPQQRRMHLHVRADAGEIPEEADVPKLVDLVGTNRLDAEMTLRVGHVRRTRSLRGHAGACERDLRGGREDERPVRMPGLRSHT